MSADFFNSAQSAVTYAATMAELILLVRLAWLGLMREFKVFSIFLAFDAVRTLALMRWDYHGLGYEWIWAVTAPLWTLLLASATLELSHGIRQPFSTEAGNRLAALYGFLIGMTVSAVASMLAHPQAISRSAILLTIIGRRSVLSGCILAILAQGAYLAIGGAPLIANWRLHRRVLLTVMATVLTASFAAGSKHRQYAECISLLSTVLSFGCFCVWTIKLQRAWSNVWDGWGDLAEEQIAETIAFHDRAAVALAKQRRRESKISKTLLPNTERREDPI